eukprot:5455285-Alexandrium_andersonii.AAC.1
MVFIARAGGNARPAILSGASVLRSSELPLRAVGASSTSPLRVVHFDTHTFSIVPFQSYRVGACSDVFVLASPTRCSIPERG